MPSGAGWGFGRRDRLHHVIGGPCLERHDGGRIALEDAIRERIDLIENRLHFRLPQ
jgi:hypothetical protein